MSCSCSGNCGSCKGCGKALELTQPEIDLLQSLGQLAFLPVARRADDMTPIYLEDRQHPLEHYSIALQLLEKKDLIDIDYSSPLKGYNMAAYAGYPVHGTIGLTARGQQVLALMDTQGIENS